MVIYILYGVLPIIGGLILYAIIHVAVRYPGRRLNSKFVSLGTLKGKTYSQIVSVVGQESSRSSMVDGIILRQWITTGYHISLIFDENNVCLGVEDETSV